MYLGLARNGSCRNLAGGICGTLAARTVRDPYDCRTVQAANYETPSSIAKIYTITYRTK